MGLKIKTLLATLFVFHQISLAQPPPPVSCPITGQSPVTVGDTWTYTMGGSCSAGSWTATCGSVQSSTTTTCTVYFNMLGCGSSTITAWSGPNGTGSALNSKTVTVNQPPALVCGSINSPTKQTINYNTAPSQINAGASSGGNCGGDYGYNWHYSTDMVHWSGISGATGQNYQPGQLTTTTYYYRSTVCGIQSCQTSNYDTVVVYPQLVGGIITPGTQQINWGANASTLTLSGYSGGNGTFLLQWQFYDIDDPWVNISGATSTTYTPSSLGDTTLYRVRVISNGDTVYSDTATVNVYDQIKGTVTPTAQTVAYNTPPQPLSLGNVTGGNGSYSYQWKSSPDGTTWTTISGATGTTYSPGNITALKYYEVIITSNGDPVPSSIATVRPALNPGTIVPAALTIASGTSPGQLDADPASGGSVPGTYTYQWQDSSSSTSGTWIAISGTNTLDYSPGTLTSNIWYRRQVTSGSDVAYTNESQINVGGYFTNFSFVRERTILKAGVSDTVTADGLTSPYDVAQTTEYFDGLGRPVQTVAKQASPLQNDVVIPVVYDNFGRQAIQYMPYTATTNDGNYKPTALVDQEAFNTAQFPGEQYYYGQTIFEASPESRALETFAPGVSWVGGNTGLSGQYLINTVADSVQIWNINSTQMSLPVNGGAYSPGKLYKGIVTDEQGQQVIEYKDVLGKTILKKVQQSGSPSSGHAGWLCTYYVYDTLQNLRMIIQPQAVMLINGAWTINTTIANELCFRYEYDGRHRLTIRKVPGAGQVWMVNDARDRIAMIQDSAMRKIEKWMFVKYDALNRPDSTGFITDPSNFNNLAYHDTLAAYSSGYPVVGGYTNELLTQNFYDNYSWVSTYGAPVGSSMATNYTSNGSYFITTYNSSPTYAVAVSPFPITRGMPTGSMKKVIGTASQYLYAVNFFDDRARIVQTQSVNYTGAIDTITIQYNFSGAALRTLLNHKKSGNTVQGHIVSTKMDYDPEFRLRHTWKNIDNAASDQLIDSLQYNELGQLVARYLGNQVDSVVYSYNVRGWLTGINKNYVAGTANHFFGMELGYDKTSSVAPGNTYLNPQFNGSIEGVVWKSAGRQINRKYDYTYDAADRLTSASFLQNTTGLSWDKSQVDYSVSGLRYDVNGNILAMTQRGFTVGGSAPIDSLTYSYLNADSSNKLMGVTDAVNNPSSLLEDFHYNTSTKQATDYNYDGNGNQTHDNNKNIDTIQYNYLNLPTLIHIKGEGNVAYTYDAAGIKLTKVTTDSVARHSNTTLYVAGFVYQQTDTITNPGGGTDTLQFLGHEEGRARWAYHKYTTGSSAYKFEYDFFETDHLGNTRMVLTQERDTTNYLATMEAAYRSTEVQLFGNIPNTCVLFTSMPNSGSIGSGKRYLYTNPNDSVSRVDSSSTGGQKVGPNLILKVMSGDTVNLSVQCYYVTPGGGSTNSSSFSDVLTSLANGLVNLTSGEHGTVGNLTGPGSTVYSGVSSFLNSDDTANSGYPKAYLNWIFLDDQFNYDSTLSGSVLAASSTYPAGSMNLVAPGGGPIAMKKSGFLYIWVSNETTGWDVYYDNLSVQYKQGPLLEENHYYPFGLTMAGISDKAIKTSYAENKYRYNGATELQNKEFADGNGVEMYDAAFRRLDPQLGRFAQIDPMADATHFFSTYQYAANNPVSLNDASGLYQQSPQTRATEEYLMNQTQVGGGGGYIYASMAQAQSAINADFESVDNFFATTGSGDAQNSGSNWIAKAEAIFNDPGKPYGGTLTPNGNGGFTEYDYSSEEEAKVAGASEAYLSGYWGGSAASKFRAVTGGQYSLPVLDVGRYSNGAWTTLNGDDLQNQLHANGAIFGAAIINYANPFLDNTSFARTVGGIMAVGPTGANWVVDQARGANNFMSVRSSLNASQEINSIRNISKIGAVADFAGKALGVVAVADHSIQAYEAFKSGDIGYGILNVAKVGLDVFFMFAKANPVVLAASLAYTAVDIATTKHE